MAILDAQSQNIASMNLELRDSTVEYDDQKPVKDDILKDFEAYGVYD